MRNIQILSLKLNKRDQALQAIAAQMAHFAFFLEHPETHRDIWLHDLIYEALTYEPTKKP